MCIAWHAAGHVINYNKIRIKTIIEKKTPAGTPGPAMGESHVPH